MKEICSFDVCGMHSAKSVLDAYTTKVVSSDSVHLKESARLCESL